MVGLWGMSSEAGLVSYGLGETHPFLGREISQGREYSEETAAALDRSVRLIIDQAFNQARGTLEAHRRLLDTLAGELIAHETVDGQRLDALLAEDGAQPVMTDGLAAPAAAESAA